MTNELQTESAPLDVAFWRLHTLAACGFRPSLGIDFRTTAAIELSHPLHQGENGPPNLTLWADGTLATPNLLWPGRYVPMANGSPDWQRFIAPWDADGFENFASSIGKPKMWEVCYGAISLRTRSIGARIAMGAAAGVAIAVLSRGAFSAFV